MEFLGHRQIGEQGLLFRAVTCLHCPRFGGFYEVTGSATRPQQESIDAMRCGLGVLEHVVSPGNFGGVWSMLVLTPATSFDTSQ